MPDPIPSAESLHEITAAVHDLLNTSAKYEPLLDGPPSSNPASIVLPSFAVLQSLCRLEKLLNPRRLPYSPALAVDFIVRGWPDEIMAALPVLREHVYEIVKRWDVPEVCDDRQIVRQGELSPPRTMTAAERERLECVLTTLLEVCPSGRNGVVSQTETIEGNPPIWCTQADILHAAGLKSRARYLDKLVEQGGIAIVERAGGHKGRHLVQFTDPDRREAVERGIRERKRKDRRPHPRERREDREGPRPGADREEADEG
jgi:hypothetical protein